MAARKFCVNCHYPMLPLARFEGGSSLEAPIPDASRWHNHWTPWLQLSILLPVWWGLSALAPAWWLGDGWWHGKKRKKRRRQVLALKRRVLPVDPEAQVCPLCLAIEWSFVRL